MLITGSGLLLGLPWLPGVKSRLVLGLLMLLLGLLLTRRGSRLALSLAQLRGLATQLAQAQQHGQLQNAWRRLCTAKEPVAVVALRQALLGMQQSLVDRLAAAARAQEILEAASSMPNRRAIRPDRAATRGADGAAKHPGRAAANRGNGLGWATFGGDRA